MSPPFVRFFPSAFVAFASLAVAVFVTPVMAAQSTVGLADSRSQASSAVLPDAPSAQHSLFARLEGVSAPLLSSSSQQQTPPPQDATAQTNCPADQTPEQHKACIVAAAQVQVKKEETQRNLFILPAFNTVIAGVSPPLTPGQKWDLVYHTAKDPYTFAIAFIVSGIGEAEDNSDYGWGPAGYFKDVGAAYLDNVDGAIIGNAILPILLRQDPRYFRLGHGSILRRVLNAAGSTVIARGDNGKTQFNTSNVLGNFISGGISNLYYPADQRGASLTINNAIVVTAEGAIGAQLLEFGPDINALIARRQAKAQARKAAKNGTAPAPAATPNSSAPTPPSAN